MNRADRGFTLLEILAALAIAAIGFAAVAKSAGSATEVLQATENRLLATWVAGNRLAEMRLSRKFPSASTHDRSAVMGGRTWYFREEVSTTADPDLVRIDVTVYSDSDYSRYSGSVFGYQARYLRTQESDDH